MQKIPMPPQTKQIKVALTSFTLMAFLLCGVSGLFCPMPASATNTPSSQPASHHSSSQNGDCPDQFKNAENESKPLPVALLQVETLENLGSWPDLVQSRLFQRFFKARALTPSSYPLLFLRFSALLNWVPWQPSCLRIQKCDFFLGSELACIDSFNLGDRTWEETQVWRHLAYRKNSY